MTMKKNYTESNSILDFKQHRLLLPSLNVKKKKMWHHEQQEQQTISAIVAANDAATGIGRRSSPHQPAVWRDWDDSRAYDAGPRLDS